MGIQVGKKAPAFRLPDAKVKKHWPLVRKAAEHPAEVLAALQGET